MTYKYAYTMAGRTVRKEVTNEPDEVILQECTQLAAEELSAYRSWWFYEVELAFTLAAGTRRYAFQTQDLQGNTIRLREYDIQTFRSATRNHIGFVARKEIDHDYPDWWATTSRGSIDRWTFSGDRVSFHKTPSAAFVAANASVWCTGWRMGKYPVATVAADTDQILFTAEIDFPGHWHPLLVKGIKYHAFEQSRIPEGAALANARKAWYDGLDEMVDKCVPYQGQPSDQSPPARQFLRGFGSRSPGQSDYAVH